MISGNIWLTWTSKFEYLSLSSGKFRPNLAHLFLKNLSFMSAFSDLLSLPLFWYLTEYGIYAFDKISVNGVVLFLDMRVMVLQIIQNKKRGWSSGYIIVDKKVINQVSQWTLNYESWLYLFKHNFFPIVRPLYKICL